MKRFLPRSLSDIMPKVDVTVPHGLGQEEAQRRVQKLLSGLQGQKKSFYYKLIEATWVELGGTLSFTLEVIGDIIHGRVTTAPSYVRVSTDSLPFAAHLIVWYISNELKEKLTEALKP